MKSSRKGRLTIRKKLIFQTLESNSGEPMLLDELRWLVLKKESILKTGEATRQLSRSDLNSFSRTIREMRDEICTTQLLHPDIQPVEIIAKECVFRIREWDSIEYFLNLKSKNIFFQRVRLKDLSMTKKYMIDAVLGIRTVKIDVRDTTPQEKGAPRHVHWPVTRNTLRSRPVSKPIILVHLESKKYALNDLVTNKSWNFYRVTTNSDKSIKMPEFSDMYRIKKVESVAAVRSRWNQSKYPRIGILLDGKQEKEYIIR